ncbi:MAG TPA: hypothetical protein VK679_05380 [Gemmatimonadaceae bacterium]|jgi:hypothetical protein|nr:hypothetical protein [Gemmatimonadaceae bacterium]
MTHSRWTLATALLLFTACSSSSSTSPQGQSPAQVAAYYDALAGTHLAAGTGADSIDAEFISVLNGPIAYGQLPTKISVSASGVAQTWYANAAIFVDSAQSDSEIFISMWADTVVSSFMLAEAINNTLPGLEAGVFYLATGPGSSADSSTVTVAPAVKSSSCATNISISHVYSFAPTYDPVNTTCTPASATVGGHLHFQAEAGIASQYQDIDLTSTAISGVRLQATHGSTFARVRALPHGTIRLN